MKRPGLTTIHPIVIVVRSGRTGVFGHDAVSSGQTNPDLTFKLLTAVYGVLSLVNKDLPHNVFSTVADDYGPVLV